MNGTAPPTLIMLAWNGWELTRRALDSLLATALDGARVLVVDNGSSDATAAGLAAYADRIQVLRLAQNLGYVRGNNAGIAAADARADVVLLNNDLEFVQYDWLRRLRACAAAEPRRGIVGCRLVDGAGRLLHAGSRVLGDDARGVQLDSGRVERDIGQYAGRDRAVQGVVFAVAYLKRAVLDAIGPLHADYDTYFEDSDYCLRARDAGFATLLCGGVEVVHRVHGSTADDAPRRAALYAQGQATFRRHWQARLQGSYRHTLVWQSALEFPPRYAAWSRPLLPALDAAGVDLRCSSLYRDLPPRLREDADSHHHVLNLLRARPVPARPARGLACGEPALFRHLDARCRIGWSDFAEPAALDAATVAAWNALDRAWVPSAWHAHTLRDAGVTTPIEVLAPGVDLDYCHPQLRVPPRAADERVFLLQAAWTPQERPWCVLRAFARAFRRRDPVRLLACLDPAGVDLAAAWRALALDPHGGRIDVLVDRAFPGYQRGLVYRAADVLVAVPVGADADLGLRAAMAAGLPPIAPAHPARSDWLHAARAWPLPAQGAQAGAAAEALLAAALVDTLRAVAAQPAAVAARGAQAARHAAAHFDVAQTAQCMAARLETLVAAAAPRPARPRPAPPRGRVLVLGMHRSGTSCVAGALQAMGLYGGEPGTFLANEAENPCGFFERADLHAACVRALERRGGDWSIPLGWSESEAAPARAAFRRELAPILAALEARGGWFVKEPRLCLLAAECLDLIEAPLLVHVLREPTAVARSLAQRDGLTLPHGLALWECYTLALLRAARGRELVRLDYAALQAAPAATLAALHAALTAQGAAGLRALQPAECAAWVRPQFDRAGVGAALPLPPAIDALWRALRDGGRPEPPPPLSDASAALLQQLHGEHAARRRQDATGAP